MHMVFNAYNEAVTRLFLFLRIFKYSYNPRIYQYHRTSLVKFLSGKKILKTVNMPVNVSCNMRIIRGGSLHHRHLD